MPIVNCLKHWSGEFWEGMAFCRLSFPHCKKKTDQRGTVLLRFCLFICSLDFRLEWNENTNTTGQSTAPEALDIAKCLCCATTGKVQAGKERCPCRGLWVGVTPALGAAVQHISEARRTGNVSRTLRCTSRGVKAKTRKTVEMKAEVMQTDTSSCVQKISSVHPRF